MGYRGSRIGRIFLINQSQYQIVWQGALYQFSKTMIDLIARKKVKGQMGLAATTAIPHAPCPKSANLRS